MTKPIVRSVVVIVGILLAAGVVGAHCSLEHEVEVIGDKLTKAMLDDDLDAMLEYYVDDAISLPMFSPMLEGKKAMIEHHAEMKKSGVKIQSFSSTPSTVWSEGDAVIEIGSYEITLEMPGAPGPVNDHGKYMTVYERQEDGSLKIKAETWNTDMDPMAMTGGHDHDHHLDEDQ